MPPVSRSVNMCVVSEETGVSHGSAHILKSPLAIATSPSAPMDLRKLILVSSSIESNGRMHASLAAQRWARGWKQANA
jgi:hypothetical protein